MSVSYAITDQTEAYPWLLRDAIRYVAEPERVTVAAAIPEVFMFRRPVDHRGNDLATRFDELATQWEAEVRYISSATQMLLNAAYQQIIGMGPVALPLILRRLAERPHHWFWALQSIAGENPVPAESAGNIRKMTHAWLEWGRDHGYI